MYLCKVCEWIRSIYKMPIDDVYYRRFVCARYLEYFREGRSPFERRHRLVSIGRGLWQWWRRESFAV